MALDKNDGVFLPSIEGVVSGKTSQVDGMNGLLNDLIGNDNYLKDKKLDIGSYTGTAEKLHTDSNAIWGGLDGGGRIEDTTVVKVVGKRYIGADGKAYICKVPSNINNTTNYTPCNVVDNMNFSVNLIKKSEQTVIVKTGNVNTTSQHYINKIKIGAYTLITGRLFSSDISNPFTLEAPGITILGASCSISKGYVNSDFLTESKIKFTPSESNNTVLFQVWYE